MANLRRPLIINFLSTTGSTIVQFVVSIVLARLLSPSEIGVFSMTAVFVNVAHMFRDFGVATYLEREPELTPAKIRSSIGVLFTTSWIMALMLFLASNWIADWFKEPNIIPVMRVLALGFLFIPFGSVTNALLTREFAAGKQAMVNIAGTTTYTVTCLGLALNGFGTMSLAWANLANIIVCAIAFVPHRPANTPWFPSFRKWGEVLHFGVGSLLTNCANAVNNAIPDVLLGKLGSAHYVGMFSRASSTVSIFGYVAGSTVNYGSVPYFAAAHHQGKALPPLVGHATALITGVGWPALALTALLGKQIVLTLYGPNWLECVSSIPALTFASAIGLAFHYTVVVLTALGRPYLSAVPVVINIIMRVSLGIALYDGSVKTFAWVVCISSIITVPVMLMQQRKYYDFKIKEAVWYLLPSAYVTVICASAGYLFLLFLPPDIPALFCLLILALPLAVTWYFALRLAKHPLLKEVHHIFEAIRTRLF